MKSASPNTWRTFLEPYAGGERPLLGSTFIERWGDEVWAPTDDDRAVAARIHTQIASRVATQRLGYREGSEKAALASVFGLFQSTRDAIERHPACRLTDAVAWEVLNTHVRPFTSKWHRQSERNNIAALDATDEFRTELASLQPLLHRFDALLIHIRDGREGPVGVAPASSREAATAEEMQRPLAFGISPEYGGLTRDLAEQLNTAERAAVELRRRYYADAGAIPEAEHAVGLALSGGGIRSATFSLGVLVALARRGVLPQVDFLSTVSGGGYVGAFLSAFMNAPATDADEIGLRPSQVPFSRANGESPPLRYIRHHSKYLASGSLWGRMHMIGAQAYGMVLNGIAIVYLVACVVLAEVVVREWTTLEAARATVTSVAIAIFFAAALASLSLLRFSRQHKQLADQLVTAASTLLMAVYVWYEIPSARDWIYAAPSGLAAWLLVERDVWIAILGGIPLVLSAMASLLARRFVRTKEILVVVAALAVPICLVAVYVAIYAWVDAPTVRILNFGTVSPRVALAAIVAAGGGVYFGLFDVNATATHRHYRDRLAGAYVIQSRSGSEPQAFKANLTIPLSTLGKVPRAPYHLINGALNVPGSNNPAMQGRLTDFFLFSARYCGSPLTGYWPTEEWESREPHLDLATAMAISGAAAGPQMGLGTMRHLSFWLALVNVRLGYWLPNMNARQGSGAPGLGCLLREMLGNMHERLRWLNVSDGGHIENLGIYELLRRQCKYIIAIDGEQDHAMTFHGLTNLQRMAAIDLGVTIDLDLADLRRNDSGLSRSHFHFCRIRYKPHGRDGADAFGYLLYVKLSLTGNEGEFIRRYRLDEPVFPHHSTADQLFSETQFEAYRMLGEHVGDKLFLRPLVGDLGEHSGVDVGEWFRKLGQGLLEPI